MAITDPPDLMPITRAARIVAPIAILSDDLLDKRKGDFFHGGVRQLLAALGSFEMRVAASCLPAPMDGITSVPLSKDWFSETRALWMRDHYEQVPANSKFIEWARDNLWIAVADVDADLGAYLRMVSSGPGLPVENVVAAGTSWSFPQTLAWIATRDVREVARLEHQSAWLPIDPPDDDFDLLISTPENRAFGRRFDISRLVLLTALDHCKCGSMRTAEKEAWEICQCVGQAYDELCSFAKGSHHPIPEYQPRPAYASFTLTWPEGAHSLRFRRSEVMENWPDDLHSPCIANATPTRLPLGEPGRPNKGYELYLAEFEQRAEQGICANNLAEEARILLDWFTSKHPHQSAPTVKTIQNRIRVPFKVTKQKTA